MEKQAAAAITTTQLCSPQRAAAQAVVPLSPVLGALKV
jgi:hypothetical protein